MIHEGGWYLFETETLPKNLELTNPLNKLVEIEENQNPLGNLTVDSKIIFLT